MNQNNKACKDMTESLNVSNEIKEILFKIESVASSNNSKIKASIKDIFISSPSCKELSRIAKCYERIITSNSVYPIRGSRTYLELAFPASGVDKDYKEFFASPRLIAATQDYFTGVFLISFEQWKSANDVIRDASFKELIKFIDDNKEHISFVFHVTSSFKDSKVLCNELGKHVNLYFIEHTFPDMEHAIKYVETQLSESGIEFNTSGKREIKKLIKEKIDTTSSTYHGYRTLEHFVANLQFELYAHVARKHTESSDKESSYSISKDEIRMIADSIEIPDENTSYQRKLGFN